MRWSGILGLVSHPIPPCVYTCIQSQKRRFNWSSAERSALSIFLGIFNCKSGTDVIPFQDEGRISRTKLGFLGIISYFKSPHTVLSEFGNKKFKAGKNTALFFFLHFWRKQNAELIFTIIFLIWAFSQMIREENFVLREIKSAQV